MNPVVHFGIPYKNKERAMTFYQRAFGWKMTDLGEKKGDYVLATTTQQDAKPGFPAGAINGGLYPEKTNWPAQYPSLVLAVHNMEEGIKKIESAGGEVLGQPMELEDFGCYVSFMDTEGNRLSVIEPKM